MTNSQTNLKGTWGLTYHAPKSHCSISMINSFFMPQSKAQAIKWLGYMGESEKSKELLSQGEVDEVAQFMSQYGKEANFVYTKSKSFVRLANFQEFIFCVKAKFSIK